MPVREESVKLAVNFLSDPKVQQSTLAKRIAFLESKGLNSEEIEEAVQRTNSKDSNAQTQTAAPASASAASPPPPRPVAPYPQQQLSQGYPQYPPYPPYPYPPPPQQPPAYQPSWKDYTLGVIGVAAIGYGVYELGKKYVAPYLLWPSEAKLAADQKAMEDKLELVNSALKEAREEAEEIAKSVDTHSEKVGTALDALRESIAGIEVADSKRDADIKSIKDDIDSLKVMVPKILEKAEHAQNTMMEELQNEVKSLRNLLLNRRMNSFPAPNPQAQQQTQPFSGSNMAGGSPNLVAGQQQQMLTSVDAGPNNVANNNAFGGAGPNGSYGGAPVSAGGASKFVPPFGKPVGIPAWQLASSGASGGSSTSGTAALDTGAGATDADAGEA